ncbi:hypothetical protein HJD07_09690 [Enterococcus faecium]|nr:hypothetical protein [Enterococcus faecium]HAZ0641055.1 hypothetical protein [Enterococcus faecium]HCR4222728.1 hypothetical protein [Enterococcus faecium]
MEGSYKMTVRKELVNILEQEGNEKDFKYKGYDCHIRRVGVPCMGHLCGYIEIPKTHSFYEKDYDTIEEICDYELPAHGGLTFSGFVNNEYWIGFDCAHAGDLLPMFPEEDLFPPQKNDTYKTMEFVENNIKEIIDFIKKS